MYGQWACLTCVQYIPIVRQWPFGSLSWWQVDCLCVPSWENRVLQFLPGSLQPWRLKAYLKEPPVCHPAVPLISLTSSCPALPWQPVTSHTRVWDVTPHIVLCSTCLQFLWLYVLMKHCSAAVLEHYDSDHLYCCFCQRPTDLALAGSPGHPDPDISCLVINWVGLWWRLIWGTCCVKSFPSKLHVFSS